MKSMLRVTFIVVAFITAGCVSNVEVDQVSASAAADATLSYSEMHAAIPASKISGNVFEYH